MLTALISGLSGLFSSVTNTIGGVLAAKETTKQLKDVNDTNVVLSGNNKVSDMFATERVSAQSTIVVFIIMVSLVVIFKN